MLRREFVARRPPVFTLRLAKGESGCLAGEYIRLPRGYSEVVEESAMITATLSAAAKPWKTSPNTVSKNVSKRVRGE